jgi:hypothetical protein
MSVRSFVIDTAALGFNRLRTRDLANILARDEYQKRAEAAEAAVKQHEDLLASIVLYINWRFLTKQLTTEQKDLFADALERDAIRTHGPEGDEPDPEMARPPSYAPRWWRTAEEDQSEEPPCPTT